MGIVLLAKRDHTETEVLSRVLSADGTDVGTVETAEEVRACVRSPYTEAGVVDVDQWGLQGIHEVLKLKEHGGTELPVLFLSSGACVEAEEAAWMLQAPAVFRVRHPWSAGKPAPQQGGRVPEVLVVDDEGQVRRLLTEWLKRLGFSARAVASGEEAMEFIRSLLPDLVLLDIEMPGLNGVEVLARMRQRLPNASPLPVVMLSGGSDRTLPKASLVLGASAFVPKPAALAVLRLAIRLTLRQEPAT